MRFPSMFLAVVFMACMVPATGCKVEPKDKPAEVTQPAAPVEVPSVPAEPVQSEATAAPSSATADVEPVPVTMAQPDQPAAMTVTASSTP